MPRSGTLILCVQNLDFSGANQVVLNLVAGKMHESNVVVVSPKSGPFSTRFVESGAAVRVGDLQDILHGIRDVFCIMCNTIMTADIIVAMADGGIPTIWILHEWWTDEMIKENLKIRNYQGLTLHTVKDAMKLATRIVCVCESQRQLYDPPADSTVIYVGVPDPVPIQQNVNIIPDEPSPLSKALCATMPKKGQKVFTFLCLGIICPRKNQLWTVHLFKKFAGNKRNVRLQIVGARYTRQYEIDYLEKVKEAIGDDKRIELYDVTDNVEQFYRSADALILTSLNEVTPMVISEALSWGIPVLSTNIAGIKEMYEDGVEGFLFSPDNEKKALQSMETIYANPILHNEMSINARLRYERMFDLDMMVESFRQLMLTVAPPVILIDLEGTLLVDKKSYPNKKRGIESTLLTKGSSIELPQRCCSPASQIHCMEGAIEALQEMEEAGFQLFIVTSPMKGMKYCAQEKLEWIRMNLGEKWMEKVILCQDKTTISGDILIRAHSDDALFASKGYQNTPTWRQIIFDQPYNRHKQLPRLCGWSNWKKIIYPMFGSLTASKLFELSHSDDVDEGNNNGDQENGILKHRSHLPTNNNNSHTVYPLPKELLL